MPVPGGKFTYQYTVTNIGRKMGRFNITASVDNYVSKDREHTNISRIQENLEYKLQKQIKVR